MKILVVDDDALRRDRLIAHLSEKSVCQSADIEWVDCIDRAKDLLSACYFDVMILDVVLPKRSGETPDPQHCVSLLGQLNRSPRLMKPEKIIGLTAHVSDISRFKAEFEKFCLTVIEAPAGTGVWKDQLVGALLYTASSKLSRVVVEQELRILTIHGIRTFGEWQQRFQRIVQRKVSGVRFSSYKYGYFSAIGFLIPIFREIQVRRLASHLQELFKDNIDSTYIIFCHSFGTFLAANALKRLIAEGHTLPLKALVLSGSVLPETFDWGFLFRTTEARVINDCADRDYVLWCSKALTLGTGMAGKSGFFGIQNNRLVNRYFTGGHSSYFDGDEFMEKYWIPILNYQDPVSPIDQRKPSPLIHGVAEKLVLGMGLIKPFVYGIFAFGFLIWFVGHTSLI